MKQSKKAPQSKAVQRARMPMDDPKHAKLPPGAKKKVTKVK